MSWYGEKCNRDDSTGEKTLNNLRQKVWRVDRSTAAGERSGFGRFPNEDRIRKQLKNNLEKIWETNAHQNIKY